VTPRSTGPPDARRQRSACFKHDLAGPPDLETRDQEGYLADLASATDRTRWLERRHDIIHADTRTLLGRRMRGETLLGPWSETPSRVRARSAELDQKGSMASVTGSQARSHLTQNCTHAPCHVVARPWHILRPRLGPPGQTAMALLLLAQRCPPHSLIWSSRDVQASAPSLAAGAPASDGRPPRRPSRRSAGRTIDGMAESSAPPSTARPQSPPNQPLLGKARRGATRHDRRPRLALGRTTPYGITCASEGWCSRVRAARG
jgi:hypothetical protein